MPDLRDEGLARELLAAVGAIPCDSLSVEENTQLAVTKAQLLYHAGDRLASLKQLKAALLELSELGIVNSTVGDVYVGLGAIRCYEGRYREASVDFTKAYEVFARIGNEAGQTGIAAQIALCCGRLGDYSDQITWSQRVATIAGCSVIGYYQLQAAYYESFALAMRGETKQSLERMLAFDHDSQSFANPWLVQAWKLAKADVLYLCGHHAAGIAVAKEGTHYPNPVLHATSFAGAFARWLALIGESEHQVGAAAEEIDFLRANLEKYDALDQVEILYAHAMSTRNRDLSLSIGSQLAARLDMLPGPVLDQLRRLGLRAGG